MRGMKGNFVFGHFHNFSQYQKGSVRSVEIQCLGCSMSKASEMNKKYLWSNKGIVYKEVWSKFGIILRKKERMVSGK